VWGVVVIGVSALLHQSAGAATGSAPRVTARAALLMDARTGEVSWAKNPDLELPPASTTKVMTAVLALESGQLHHAVTASRNACSAAPRKLHLRPGQRLILEDLVYAIMLNSANDASEVIAEKLAGSVPAFGERMTARARELGATRTRFVNPHGLPAKGHSSTVRDLATIFRHALGVPRFREILGTKSLVIGAEAPRRTITLQSHNQLLERYRAPVIGKTGYTIAAKKCFVGAARVDGREIIVALLGSTDMWGDAQRLLDFAFGKGMPVRPEQQLVRRKAPQHRPAAPAPARAATAKRPATYAIHVGTFDRIDRAERLQRALGSRGFEAAIDRVASGQGKNRRTQYRVELGPFKDRGEAESTVRTMSAEVDLPARIVQR
jgi:D-alanyl-D-alanine carboxypeptidase (penicillin-binding protein 5/6)